MSSWSIIHVNNPTPSKMIAASWSSRRGEIRVSCQLWTPTQAGHMPHSARWTTLLVWCLSVSCFAKCTFASQTLQCRCWEWLTGSGVPWQTSITRQAPVLRLSARCVIVSIIEIIVNIIKIIVSSIDFVVSSISIDGNPPFLNIKAWNGLMKNPKKSQV